MRDVVSYYAPGREYMRYVFIDGYETEWEQIFGNFMYKHTHRGRGEITRSNGINPTPYSGYAENFRISQHRRSRTKSWSRAIHPITGRLEWCRREYKDLPYIYQMSMDIRNNDSRSHGASWRSARAAVLSSLVNSEVNAGQALGELPESLRMIAGNSITVLQAYKALRKGQFARIPKILGIRKLSDLPKGTADVWFAYKFGWLPLIEDAYNIHSAVLAQMNRSNGRIKVTRTGYDNVAVPERTKATQISVKRGTKVGLNYSIANRTLAGLNSLGLVNPVALAWELMPLSFVVNWFIPIGSFLEQTTARLGLEFHSGYRTDFYEAKGKIVWHDQDRTPDQVSRPSVYTFDQFRFDRYRLTDFPTPALSIKTGLDRNQVLTLLGLLAQRA